MATIGPFFPNRGLNTSASVFTLPKDQASTFDDVIISESGITNRYKIIKLNSSATDYILSLGSWIDPSQFVGTNSPLIVAMAGTGSSAKKVMTGVLDPGLLTITLTDRSGALVFANQANGYTHGALNGIFFGFGGSLNSDPVFKITAYNGNASALGGSPPTGDCVVVVNNYVFVGRSLASSSTYSRVYWSNVGDPETWGASNFLDFRKNDGDIISALSYINNDLIIFKQRSIGKLGTIGTQTSGSVLLGPLETINTAIGCIGKYAVDRLPDGRIIFMDNNFHVQIFDGYTFTDITDPKMPEPNVQNSMNDQFYSYSSGSFVRAWPSKNLVIVRFSPYTGSQAKNYAFDYKNMSWSKWTLTESDGVPGNVCFGLATPSQNSSDARTSHMITGTTDGYLWLLDPYTTGGLTDVGGNNVSGSIVLSIQLQEGFIPRTVLIPAVLESGATLTVTIGYNGTFDGSSSSTVGTPGILWNLVDVRSRKTSMLRPYTMQIQILVTAGKTFTLYPIYISDEVMTGAR